MPRRQQAPEARASGHLPGPGALPFHLERTRARRVESAACACKPTRRSRSWARTCNAPTAGSGGALAVLESLGLTARASASTGRTRTCFSHARRFRGPLAGDRSSWRSARASGARSPPGRGTRRGRAASRRARGACASPWTSRAPSLCEGVRRKRGWLSRKASQATNRTPSKGTDRLVLRPVTGDSSWASRSAMTSSATTLAFRTASARVRPYARAPIGSTAAIQRPSISLSTSIVNCTSQA